MYCARIIERVDKRDSEINVKKGSDANSGAGQTQLPTQNHDAVREEKIRPEVLRAIEDTLQEGAEVWLELAKH